MVLAGEMNRNCSLHILAIEGSIRGNGFCLDSHIYPAGGLVVISSDLGGGAGGGGEGTRSTESVW